MNDPNFHRLLYDLADEMCRIRDMMEPIITGKIERGHSLAGCPNGVLNPGLRKTTLADARKIAEAVVCRANRATSAEKMGEPKHD